MGKGYVLHLAEYRPQMPSRVLMNWKTINSQQQLYEETVGHTGQSFSCCNAMVTPDTRPKWWYVPSSSTVYCRSFGEATNVRESFGRDGCSRRTIFSKSLNAEFVMLCCSFH